MSDPSQKKKDTFMGSLMNKLKALDVKTLRSLKNTIEQIIRWKTEPSKFLEPIYKDGTMTFKEIEEIKEAKAAQRGKNVF